MKTRRWRLELVLLALGAAGAGAQPNDAAQPADLAQPNDAAQPDDAAQPSEDEITQAALDASPQLRNPEHADVAITAHVVEPRRLEPTPERLAQLELPAGFEIDVFADNLVDPRMLAVADDGAVYVTRRAVGDVVMLKDTDGDGRADVGQRVASRPGLHGIAVAGDTVYLAAVNELYRAPRNADGTLGALEMIVDDLPDGGQHPNRTLVVGPNGQLYVSVGSTCNACAETSPESATLLQVQPDGSYRTIYAAGLRNTIGFGFHPQTGELYGMDHGIDWLGDNEQHEELNRIEQGAKYGWPYVYADGKYNPQDQPPNEISMQEWAAQSVEPVGLYVPHSAPMQLAFYTGDQFPEEYRGDAFVAMRGSWNRNPPSGYEIMRIRFEDGEPVGFEAFAKGFVMRTEDGGWGHIGRLAGLAQARDGSLLVSDDTNGVIYRILYTGTRPQPESAAAAQGRPPAAARLTPTNSSGADVRIAARPRSSAVEEPPSNLALELLRAEGGPLDMTSPAFAANQPIPDVYAAEQQNISPPLAWQAGPSGTQSYVLMVEDADVRDDPPFVHWLAYNIPADVTVMREGIPGTPRLPLPSGMLQGRNDRGSIGYTGMKPPIGQPAHEYHFQVFALDTMLDVPHGASRGALLAAMQGHVLAAGELVGTYYRDEAP